MKSCASCGCQELVRYGDYYYFSRVFEKAFPNLEEMYCPECILYQVDHSLMDEADLTHYYTNHYRQSVDIATAGKSAMALLNERGASLASLCSKYKPSENVNNIFELGAGYGINLLKFGQSYSKASLHSDDLNTEFMSDNIKLSKIEEGPYDIILLSHVIEHFIDPVKLVRQVVDNLATGGVLVVEVPNEGAGFLYQQKGGAPFHEPHITFFSMESLESFFSRNFLDLKIQYKGMAGAKISDEKKRRLKLNSGLRGLLRRCLSIYPPSLELAQGIFNRVTGDRQEPIELSDYIEGDDRLFLRMIFEKM